MTFVDGVLWWIVLGALLGWVAAWWLGRSTQRLLTEPVIQIVERILDNPRHIARIAALDGEVASLGRDAATVPVLQARIDELQAAPPRVVEKVVTRNVDRVVEKPVERIVDRPVPDVAAIAERDAALRAQRARIAHLEALAAVQAARLAEAGSLSHAVAAGFAGAGDAGIEIVEGIGPKIAELLRARGLGSFAALAAASPGTLREILDDHGPAYRIADPSTWPEQARLAADGRWDELRSLQDSLNAGRR